MKRQGNGAGCGCLLGILCLNVVLGGLSTAYCLFALTGRTIPWWGDALIGLVAGEVTVPLMIVLWLLSQFGVHFAVPVR